MKTPRTLKAALLLAVLAVGCGGTTTAAEPDPATTTTLALPANGNSEVRSSSSTAVTPVAAPTTVHGMGNAGGNMQAEIGGIGAGMTSWQWSGGVIDPLMRPVVAGDLAYVVLDDRIVALGLTDGLERWSHWIDHTDDTPAGQLLALDNTLIFITGSGKITVLDATTGDLVRTFSRMTMTTAPTGPGTAADAQIKTLEGTAPVLYDGLLWYAINNRLIALDPTTIVEAGVIPAADLPVTADSTLVIGNDKAFILGSQHIVAIDLTTGNELWRAPATTSQPRRQILLVGDTLIARAAADLTNPYRSNITAWNAATGTITWDGIELRDSTGKAETMITGRSLAASDETLIVRHSSGYAGVDPTTGRQTWSLDTLTALDTHVGEVSELLPATDGTAWLIHQTSSTTARAAQIDLRTGQKLTETDPITIADPNTTRDALTPGYTGIRLTAGGGTLLAHADSRLVALRG